MQAIVQPYGLLTQTEHVDGKGETDKTGKHNIQLLKTGKDPTKAFQTTEKLLHFIAFFIHFPLIFPRIHPVALWRNDWFHPQIHDHLAHDITFVGAIHEHIADLGRTPMPPSFQQFAPFGIIRGLAG